MTRKLFLGVLWLMVVAAKVRAGEPVVTNIVIENLGAGPVDETFVRSHTGMSAGAKLDRLAVSKSVKALMGTGRFSYVDVRIQEGEDGAVLVYSIRNRWRLAERISLEGVDHFREAKIRDWLGLEPGDLVDDQTLGVRTQKARDEYRKDFYPAATLSWTIEETDRSEGLAKVRIRVQEGKRSPAGPVTFVGNHTVSAKALRKAIRQPPWWNPVRWFKKKQFEADELEGARADIQALYLDRGYADAAVDEPVIGQDEKGRQTVRFTVHEGPIYRLGDISLGGVTLFPETEVKRLLALKTGDIASRNTIRNTAKAIQDFYGSRGYANADVKPVLDPGETQAVARLHFAITENGLVRLRNIRIQGNARTRDKVIRREVLVYPGDLCDRVKVERSERILTNLGYFKNVRSYLVDTSLEGEKDLIFDVEEKPTGQFMVGAGFSSIDNVMGYAELSQGNFDIKGWPYFTGGGQKLKLRGQVGSKRKLYELSFVEPWFLDRKLSLGFDLYRSEVDYSDYDVQRTGGAVTLGKALPGANRVDLRYELERTKLENFADTNEYFVADNPVESYFFDQNEDTINSSLRPSLTHDTRNNPFVPTRGDRATVFGRVAGGVLGFDTELYGMGIQGVHYMPVWRKHVLSVRARYEMVEAYGNTEDVPIDERMFLGGGRTLRGFDYREVGPKVLRTLQTEGGQDLTISRPVGGKSLAMASVEYTVPVINGIRLAAFYDIGNVWREPYELQVDDLASSTGVGIRFDIPGFPIRVDYGWVIEKDDPFTGKDPWVIWIGYDY